jgi:Na+/melibiose symporter-like transporter
MIIQIALGIVLAWIIIVYILPLLAVLLISMYLRLTSSKQVPGEQKTKLLNKALGLIKNCFYVFLVIIFLSLIYTELPSGEDIVAYTLLFSFCIWFFDLDKYLYKTPHHNKPKKTAEEKTKELGIWNIKKLRIVVYGILFVFIVSFFVIFFA